MKAETISLSQSRCCRRFHSRTEHIGLIAPASTTYHQPYHLALMFASIDHLAQGRAVWNIVSSAS
ncbi:LLM class flavin-dependent oxidoreductase [Bradyrhizobium sp. WSM1743]|uniref:LLM class flavin-dependent oxidoreductase n=1 Tax=Bradyrhizobium sp. WSM1743 TaxID=318996 RepID=UPI001FDAAE32|nr:LLM class flavin-dependent oxidoreductase [Bradyrhizobium sp. WSM1743]